MNNIFNVLYHNHFEIIHSVRNIPDFTWIVSKKIIGKGAQGYIVVFENEFSEKIAVKIINIKTIKGFRHFMGEINSLIKLSRGNKCSENVVCYYADGVKKNDPTTVFIITDYIEGKELSHLAQSSDNILQYSIGIANGLYFIHTHGIVHHDLKPENIIIDKNNNPVIVDFGLSCLNVCKYGRFGTPNYMPPEILFLHTNYDPFKSDIFSFGCLMHLMLTGRHFYSKVFLIKILKVKVSKKLKKLEKECSKFYKKAKNRLVNDNLSQFRINLGRLTIKCLNINPDSRPSIDYIRENLILYL